jgi:hypothetical protein
VESFDEGGASFEQRRGVSFRRIGGWATASSGELDQEGAATAGG